MFLFIVPVIRFISKQCKTKILAHGDTKFVIREVLVNFMVLHSFEMNLKSSEVSNANILTIHTSVERYGKFLSIGLYLTPWIGVGLCFGGRLFCSN